MIDEQSVTARMRSLVEEFEAGADRRAIFLSCYLLMTENMLSAVEAGEFYDPEWVDTLLHHFAGYYFEGVTAYALNESAASAV
ncbi:MAG: DUF5995 family protein, partial [Candidatus Promineifilaceae bacterium]